MRRVATIVALLLATPAVAADPVARFESYARLVGPLCATAPSTHCFEQAFEGADRDDDGGLSLAELELMRDDLHAWVPARGHILAAEERMWLGVGLRVVDTIGLASLHAAFDADGDGAVDRAELQADVALDERPLAVVVQDPDAVDWAALQARLGALAAALIPR